jgi:hypothetical protein
MLETVKGQEETYLKVKDQPHRVKILAECVVDSLIYARFLLFDGARWRRMSKAEATNAVIKAFTVLQDPNMEVLKLKCESADTFTEFKPNPDDLALAPHDHLTFLQDGFPFEDMNTLVDYAVPDTEHPPLRIHEASPAAVIRPPSPEWIETQVDSGLFHFLLDDCKPSEQQQAVSGATTPNLVPNSERPDTLLDCAYQSLSSSLDDDEFLDFLIESFEKD